MKEISLNILDIAENSVKAGATLIEIDLTQSVWESRFINWRQSKPEAA